MGASGFAGLAYQIVWTQQASLWLGYESAAVMAVVTAFFGGLSAGAFALGSRIARSTRPVRWYAACEMLIAAWSLLLNQALSPLNAWLLTLTGSEPSPLWQWSVAFCGTFLLLLPATAAMGATLPAMERVTAQWRNAGHTIAPLYAANTIGAVIGVLASTFFLIPTVGLKSTAAICVSLNVLCCVVALTVFAELASPPSSTPQVRPAAWQHALRLALTGLLGIGYEVITVRVLSQVAEDTVYTFALLLAVYLLGTALGAAVYHRSSQAVHDAERLAHRLYTALAMSCLLGAGSLWAAQFVKTCALHLFGTGMGAALGAEAVLAMAAFGPPTVIMGALFSHLTHGATRAGLGFGTALGCNTLGAATAPILYGVVAFPILGPKLALLSIAATYLALNPPQRWLQPAQWAGLGALLMTAIWSPPLAFVEVPQGGHIVSYQEGAMAAVSVVEDSNGTAVLRIDNRQQEGSTASLRVDTRQALLPLLLHAAPKRALFLGLGTGVTATAATMDREVEVDAVELLPEVISASRYFIRAFPDPATVRRPHIIAADARRYMRTSKQHYDVIVADNYHPARSGSGSLYTVEHFAAVRERLASEGVFCQWLPLHQLDLTTLRTIVRSFLTIYPAGMAIVASNSLATPVIGLVARRDGQGLNVTRLSEHLAHDMRPLRLADFGLDDIYALLGTIVAGPQALAKFAGNALANTDDLPLVAYRAPRITYAPDTLPGARLLALQGQWRVTPAEVLQPGHDPRFAARLADYWRARNQFIEYGRAVRPSADVYAMLAQVREPLLDVLHISPDFRPAYDPLLRMASALASTDTRSARDLLEALSAVQPARPEAALAMQKLKATSGEAP